MSVLLDVTSCPVTPGPRLLGCAGAFPRRAPFIPLAQKCWPRGVIEYLVAENRVLKEQAKGALPVDRLPASAPRREGAPTRPAGLTAGRDHRDPRHHPPVQPAADRPEVDVRAEAARPSWDHARDLVPHSADRH